MTSPMSANVASRNADNFSNNNNNRGGYPSRGGGYGGHGNRGGGRGQGRASSRKFFGQYVANQDTLLIGVITDMIETFRDLI